ncbi:hypothetical protein NC651_031749 [Populus alba x Populus x berolinensis]|nr:hypothetical protein NC651_031749 [Populus alba x Populus x berolinensis]
MVKGGRELVSYWPIRRNGQENENNQLTTVSEGQLPCIEQKLHTANTVAGKGTQRIVFFSKNIFLVRFPLLKAGSICNLIWSPSLKVIWNVAFAFLPMKMEVNCVDFLAITISTGCA